MPKDLALKGGRVLWYYGEGCYGEVDGELFTILPSGINVSFFSPAVPRYAVAVSQKVGPRMHNVSIGSIQRSRKRKKAMHPLERFFSNFLFFHYFLVLWSDQVTTFDVWPVSGKEDRRACVRLI